MQVGRGVFCKKSTVEKAWQIDMKTFSKKVNLESYSCGNITWNSALGNKASIGWSVNDSHSIRLYYTNTNYYGVKRNFDYEVRIETTPCNYGGKRWWFLCPVCFRRCRVIYLPPGQGVFACRICHNLSYKSQQEGKNYFKILMDAMLNLPAWERQLIRTRSSRKRQKLLDMINRHTGSLSSFVHQSKNHKRKRNRNKKHLRP